MNWIPSNTLLTGDTVDLVPLSVLHFDELIKIARDQRIWEFYSFDMSTDEKVRLRLAEALTLKEGGIQFPFVIIHRKDHKVIGSTRFLEMNQKNRKLEIGWTWLHPDYWATDVNLECKLLLLSFCFEHLNTVRVTLRTDENNIRSRKAIEKIGGKFEGILRHDWIRDNGTLRNSAYYSLIHTEWGEAKRKLVSLVNNKRRVPGEVLVK